MAELRSPYKWQILIFDSFRKIINYSLVGFHTCCQHAVGGPLPYPMDFYLNHFHFTFTTANSPLHIFHCTIYHFAILTSPKTWKASSVFVNPGDTVIRTQLRNAVKIPRRTSLLCKLCPVVDFQSFLNSCVRASDTALCLEGRCSIHLSYGLVCRLDSSSLLPK
jgi:hypothetical protein